jgi:precorrin-2/cobalt-factor-2 C20-methyltransferase
MTLPSSPRLGTLYGVSLGPGDPGLITRRAWALLERRDTAWTYPARSTRTPSYAFDIVQRAELAPPTDHQTLLFPMTHDGDKLARAWLRAAEAVLPRLLAGQDVLFLVEGDASTYATFGHLARTVRTLDERIAIEVVAGVNAFTAACATQSLPLCEQDDTVALVPAAYGVSAIDRLLHDFDTLVLLKVKPLIGEIVDWLAARDLLAHSRFIERCGAPDERVVATPEALLALRDTKVSYLSLLIVKNPHRVRGERVRGCLKKTSPGVPT